MIEALTAEPTSEFDRAVAFLAKFRRKDIVAKTVLRHTGSFSFVRKEALRLCRAALAERRRVRGNKLARRLRRKVALGRSGSF